MVPHCSRRHEPRVDGQRPGSGRDAAEPPSQSHALPRHADSQGWNGPQLGTQELELTTRHHIIGVYLGYMAARI